MNQIKRDQKQIREHLANDFANFRTLLEMAFPGSRELALALTKLDEAEHWAKACQEKYPL